MDINTKKIITNLIDKKTIKKTSDLEFFFSSINDAIKKSDPRGLLLGYYLFNKISSEKVRTRKVTAREFEDFIAEPLGGVVLDTESRKNIKIKKEENIFKYDESILNYISSNRREKMDVTFENGYGLSVKTLIPKNKELNMGSFAREALFSGILEKNEYGSERKGGLGSKPQMLELFKKIERNKQWKEFVDRFSFMIKNIFDDDIIVAIKNDIKLDIFIMSGKDMQNVLIGYITEGPGDAVKIINRYEGNSIRIDRDAFLEKAKKITLDFSDLKDSKVFRAIKNIDKLEEFLVDYICSENRKDLKIAIKKSLDIILEEI